MKIRASTYSRLTILPTVAALVAFTPALRADWGSLRSNNHPEHGNAAEREHHEVEHGRPPVEHHAVVVEHGHPTPVAPVHVVEPRHSDFEAERRQGLYWAGYHPGLTLRSLPVGYVQVSVGGTGYYYYDGVYFRPTTDGTYIVVAPPVGAIVPQLPNGAQAIGLGSDTYYYGGGAFYLQQPTGFGVVEAPLGLTVADLPPGAALVVIDGVIYYVAGSSCFLPVRQAGVTVYVTAQP